MNIVFNGTSAFNDVLVSEASSPGLTLTLLGGQDPRVECVSHDVALKTKDPLQRLWPIGMKALGWKGEDEFERLIKVSLLVWRGNFKRTWVDHVVVSRSPQWRVSFRTADTLITINLEGFGP